MKKFTRTEPTIENMVGNAFKRSVVIKHFTTDDGLTHEFTTFFSDTNRSVALFALDQTGQLIVVRQFRPGPEKWLYQLPSGGVEEGESLEIAARRELNEEAGYDCQTMEYLGPCYDDAYINVKQYVFFADNCMKMEQQHRFDPMERAQGSDAQTMNVKDYFGLAMQGETIYNSAFLRGYEKYIQQRGDA